MVTLSKGSLLEILRKGEFDDIDYMIGVSDGKEVDIHDKDYSKIDRWVE